MNAITIIFLLCAAIGSAWSCPVNAVHVEGIAFTSGEKINLDKFESLGTQNVNYFKDSNSIRYTSHYDEDAMIFIGIHGEDPQKSQKMLDIKVILDESKLILDTSIAGFDRYKPIDKKTFNFAKAVNTELLWLKKI